MQNATLMSHVDTDLVTNEQLALVETPDATRSFKPVPHIELIDTLEHVLKLNHIAIRKEQFALRRDGLTLFGVLQLEYQDTSDGMAALGLRTSNNRTMSLQLCAGLSVFVCDNMVFRGDLIALNRKHTSGLHLRTEINHAILRFQDHFGRLTGEIAHLKDSPVSDTDAKAIRQSMKCGTCRACWNRSVKVVSYHLKWGQAHLSRGHAMRRPWPMRFGLNLIKLAAVLSRGQEGRCFSCARMFNISQSRAKIPRSFCSLTCEHVFIREHLKVLTLTDCARLLQRIGTLLTPLEQKIHHKKSGR